MFLAASHCRPDHRQLVARLHDRDARASVQQPHRRRSRSPDLWLDLFRRRDGAAVLDRITLARGRYPGRRIRRGRLRRCRNRGPPHGRQWPMLLAVFAVTAICCRWRRLSLARVQEARTSTIGRIGDRNGWVSVPGQVTDWRPDLSGANGELGLTLLPRAERRVGLHVAYSSADQTRDAKGDHADQSARANHQRFVEAGRRRYGFHSDRRATIRRAEPLWLPVLASAPAARQWFWVDGRETSNEYLAKLYQALSAPQWTRRIR